MTDPAPKKRWNPWPVALIAWFAVFILLCVVFVIKSFGMRHELVTDDYYAKGLEHDDRRAALARTTKPEHKPSIHIDASNERIIVELPEFARDAVLELYRPSDASLDRKYALQNGEPSTFSLLDLFPGRWEARIYWTTDGLAYYYKEELYVP